jgi:hypothetical protein
LSIPPKIQIFFVEDKNYTKYATYAKCGIGRNPRGDLYAERANKRWGYGDTTFDDESQHRENAKETRQDGKRQQAV